MNPELSKVKKTSLPQRKGGFFMTIKDLKKQFASDVGSVSHHASLEQIRIKYLGKKGIAGRLIRHCYFYPAKIQKRIRPAGERS